MEWAARWSWARGVVVMVRDTGARSGVTRWMKSPGLAHYGKLRDLRHLLPRSKLGFHGDNGIFCAGLGRLGPRRKRISAFAIVRGGLGTTGSEMSKNTFTSALRNAFASFLGYPPVIRELLTRRLEG